MRSLTSAMLTALAKQFTNPVFLVQQDMGASIIRSSDRELIDYGGNDYLASNGLKVENLTADEFTWSLDNSDWSMSILALANDVGGNAVVVYLHYEGEVVGRFTGVLDEWHTDGQRIVFTATSPAAKQATFPNDRAELGTFNHLPAAGTNIMWGQQTLVLTAEPN